MFDLILSWPRHLDYPEWRTWLKENRQKFNKVIIIFTNMSYNLPDMSNFAKTQMESLNVICEDNDPVAGNQDWRNVAVNKALKYSDAEWIWFTEQDFHPKEGFWEFVDKTIKMDEEHNMNWTFGAVVGERLHPCCIFMPRKVLDKTSKDFSVIPDVSDHFSRIQNELSIFETIPPELYIHESALSERLTNKLLGND